jgi:hypothetical protein
MEVQMADENETVPVVKPSRDALRAAILGKEHKPAFKIVRFFGADIEVRQPQLGTILDAQDNPDRQAGILGLIIERCFVPGTDDRVFEPEDLDTLRGKPFGKDFTDINDAIEELSGVNFQPPKPGSNDTPLN